MTTTQQEAAEREALLPCPFCGHVGLNFREGSTFRWRLAECADCGASTGEERIQTMGDGTHEEWEADVKRRMIETWNRRASQQSVSMPVGEVVELRVSDYSTETYKTGDLLDETLPVGTKLYAAPHPPAPGARQLTDEQILKIFRNNSLIVDNGDAFLVSGLRTVNIARAVIAAIEGERT